MRYFTLAILLTIPMGVKAQWGGDYAFTFSTIPGNARQAAMGGLNVSYIGNDVNFLTSNPSLSTDSISGYASFSYTDYFSDASIVNAIFQHDFGKAGHWFMAVNHLGYGQFESYDATGAATGEFNTGETMLVVGRSHSINNIRMGASLKFFTSSIAGYRANALAIDIGGVFVHPQQALQFGLVFKNIGVVLNDFLDTSDSAMPFDLQAGVTLKPQFMPVRFSFTGYNLTRGDVSYFNANDTFSDEPGTFDKLFRHINVGMEILLSKAINVQLGYNHLVRQELKLPQASGGAGLSYGFSLEVKAFTFAYARGGYHAAGSTNNFTLTVNTNELITKARQ